MTVARELPPPASSDRLPADTVAGLRQETATQILDAALAEALDHGIRRTSLSDVARRAGVSRQTVYRYWPDGQALFSALLARELIAVLPHRLPVSSQAGSGRVAALDGLVALFVRTAETVRTMPLIDRLRETDPELFSRYILERLGTSQRAMLAGLHNLLEAGRRAGFVRDRDPAVLAAMTLLIVQSAVQSAPLMAEWLDAEVWRAELHHALVGYLRPDEPGTERS